MVARGPLAWFIQSSDSHVLADGAGREHKIQLSCRRGRRLTGRMVRRHVLALEWKLLRPRLGGSAPRQLGPDELNAQGRHPIEDRLVPPSPVATAMVAVTSHIPEWSAERLLEEPAD